MTTKMVTPMKPYKLTLILIISTIVSLTLAACAPTSSESSSTSPSSNEQTLTSLSSSTPEAKSSKSAPNDGSVYILKKITHYDDDGKLVYTQTRSFDEHGNTTMVTYTEGNNDNKGSESVTVNENYSDFTDEGYAQTITSDYGKVTRSYHKDDSKLVEETTPKEGEPFTTTYEFYPTGILKSKTEVAKQDEDTTTTTTTTYYENGYLASVETSGGKDYFASYSWTFDAIGNPIDYRKYVKGTGGDYYYYVETDEYGNIASINDTEDGHAIYEYEYQKISSPSKAAFVDAMAKEI